MTTPRMPKAKTARLIVREIDGETLVYDRSRDAASCLNELAARVWRKCDGETSVAAIAAALGEDERAVWLALHQLTKAQLLTEPIAFPPGMSAAKSRREVAGRLGLGAAAFVTSIVAPMPAQAASACGTLGQPCLAASPGLLGTCCPDMDLLCSGVVGICRNPA
jgi:Coenzyme PQQ synthesis protein D (PqqD)